MNPQVPMDMAQMPGIPAWVWVVYVVIYLFFAYCMARIAVKTGLAFRLSFILALIPIANIYLIFKIAGKPGWWLILGLIPIVNIVVFIIAWLEILKKLGKPGWWVILFFIPIVNIIIFLILVFGKTQETAAIA